MVGALVRRHDGQLVVAAINQHTRQTVGGAADAYVGMRLDELYADVPAILTLARRALETGDPQTDTFPYAMRSSVGTVETEATAIPVTDDSLLVFLAPAALTQFQPAAPAVDDLSDELAATWLSEGEAAACVWRVEPDDDFTLVGNNGRAVEATKGGVLRIRGLRARSLYFDQPEVLAFLTKVRDKERAEALLPLRFVTEDKRRLRFFRTLGVRRGDHLFLFAEERTEQHALASDLATVEKRLRRAERLDSLGRLAGGIAHDFNNLLAAIVGLGELIRDQVEGPVIADVETLLASAERGAALTQRLLAFARQEEVQPFPFSVETLLADLQPMLARLVGSRVELRLEVESGLPAVLMDPGQLEQVVVNLVVNAQEAMPRGGTVTVRVRRAREADRAPFRVVDELPEGELLLLEVQDEGTGIAEELRELVFEPFVSSKDEGSGGGLGLATVKSLIVGAGGSVRLSSETGQGSTIHLLVPITGARPEPLRRSSRPPASGPTRARVLLVEDDPLLRRVLRRSLSRDGFEVMTARDGREALEQLEGHADWPIDILVTDVVMPHVSGPELARTLRERRPELPVVFCSGHHTETLIEEIAPPVEALAKPMSHGALLEAMQSVLGERQEPG